MQHVPIKDVLRSLLAATGTGANEDDAALLRRLQQPEPTASASTASASTKREERTQVDMCPGEDGLVENYENWMFIIVHTYSYGFAF